MGHIFISYSHKDADYARALADHLQGMNFDVWIDARLDYGSQWPYEIQTQLDSCDAFIVIMTPRAFTSEWVQSELQRAKRKKKPIFPLLLEGDEPWLSVESTQFYDVRGGNLPDVKFYSALRHAITFGQTDETLHYIENKNKVNSSVKPAKRKLSTEILIALIGAVVTIFTACATIIGGPLVSKWMNSTDTPVINLEATMPASTPVMMSSQPSEATANAVTPDPIDDAMILIPAGEFMMGSNSGDNDEQPVHKVDLDAYFMDVHEVTNAQYKACVDAGKCQPPGSDEYLDESRANYPVNLVTWDMSQVYCEWRGARLPTEAEWEKAARGTDERVFPWGNTANCQLANYGDCNDETVAVESYPQGVSPYGLYDMGGNVFEWVADYYLYNYYSNSPGKNPPGPSTGELRVVRGGSYGYDINYIRTTVRYGQDHTLQEYGIGFRCAKTAP